MNADNAPDSSETAGVRQARAFEEFLIRLRESFDDFVADESASPPLAGWIYLDNPRQHRDNLGFARRDELLDALHARVGSLLEESDFSAVADKSAVAVILDPREGERDFRELANRLIREISGGLFELHNKMVAVSISVGLNPFNAGARSPEEGLLQAARLAESVAANGGGRARIHEPRKSGLVISQDNRSVLSLLIRSLKSNTVKVVFQPLVSVSGKETYRYQILPRLQTDDGTLIPASRFIPLAQRHGLLPALDRWMLSWALKFIRHQSKKDRSVVLFINQSAAMVEDANLIEWLEKKLQDSPGAEKGLVLEFRLDYLLGNLKEGKETLQRLIKMGAGVGISGVDESSSAEVLLEHLPSDYLRMGPGFAHRMQDDEELARRYESFARKAQDTGRKMIIPMLENADELARIWRARVDLVQGNFIQRPRENMGD